MNVMNRRRFLTMAAGCAAGISAGCVRGGRVLIGEGERPPNFIVIMADDLGAKELACYGNPRHQTPHLDRLADTGVRFEIGYAAPICHPSRFMIMTGQYGCHNGVYHFAGRRGGPEPHSPVEDIGANHVTFAEVLKKRGYATALAGKWQLSGKPPTMIHECGFDEYCIWAYLHYLPEGVEHTGAWEKAGAKPERYWHPCIMKNGEYVPTTPDDYGPDIYTDFLIDFARRHRDEPFFLYFPMCLTHAPHRPTPDNLKEDAEKHKAGAEYFQGAVEYTDTLMGRLVAALDELGLRENTVVLFTADNGTGGAGKGQPTELGARVPFIVNGPGLVKRRGGVHELADLSDVLPTLADFADAPLPEDRVIDGRSLAPYLRGDADHTRDWIFAFIGDARILRTKRWLLEDNSPHHWGRLYDCGGGVDRSKYNEVTESTDPEVVAVKERFNALLAGLPAPDVPEEGGATDKKEQRQQRAQRRKRRADAKGE